MPNSKEIITSILIVLGFTACITKNEDIFVYAAEKKSLICEMEKLKLKNDSLWNVMSLYLDAQLPSDMVPSERENMVKIKNAKLISLFKVFPKLDTAIQNKVYSAGVSDDKIAAEMKEVMDKLHTVEEKLNMALENLENRNKKEYQQLKLQIQEYQKHPCPFN